MKVKLVVIFGLLCFWSCVTEEALYEEYHSMNGEVWSAKDTTGFKFDIEETNVQYNIFLELRITDDYKYSNLYVMSSLRGSTEEKSFVRKHLLLASPEGKWFGKGNGRLITIKLPLYANTVFKKKGAYYLEIKQEMRDNPLNHIASVGVRVEKGNPVF